MKKVLLSLVMIGLICSISNAAIRRVGYTGIPLVGVDYPNITLANAASNPGDTIQYYGDLDGSGVINKRLVIMGFGYNFDVNTGLQAIGTDAPSMLNISFYPGSDSSVITGCTGAFSIYTSNITIRGCYASINLMNNATSLENIVIINCIVASGGMVYSNNPVANFQMYNSLLMGPLTFYLPASSGIINNCVGSNSSQAYLNLTQATFIVKNCIINNYSSSTTNTIYENNFFAIAQPATLPLGSNNRWSQNWGNLFSRLGGTDDDPGFVGNPDFTENFYALKTGSPAIEGGYNAYNNPTDCGIFGGESLYRYKLSGVPSVPAISQLSAPGSAIRTNPYNVTISVKTQHEVLTQ